METISAQYYEKHLMQIAAVWAIVKLSSKTVAMLQRGEISFTPFGIGLSMSPGELLAMVGDNLERIANILFMLILILLVQQFGLGLLSFVCFKILIPLCLFSYIASCLGIPKTKSLAFQLLRLSLILWLFFPLNALLSHFLQQGYLEHKQYENLHFLEHHEKQLHNIELFNDSNTTNTNNNQQHSFLDNLWENAKEIANNASMRFEHSKKEALDTINSMLNDFDTLIEKLLETTAIFLLTTFIIPLCVFIFLTVIIHTLRI